MQTFFGDKFSVQIDVEFKCDDPTFYSFEAAYDCYKKVIEMMIRWNCHDVKISLVHLVSGDKIHISDTVIV